MLFKCSLLSSIANLITLVRLFLKLKIGIYIYLMGFFFFFLVISFIKNIIFSIIYVDFKI